MGHPIADAYSTMTTEKVEVLRTPASVLYGSNAMGGVVNIITRQSKEDGVRTRLKAGGDSYGTVETEFNEFAGYIDFRQDLWGWLSLDAGFRVKNCGCKDVDKPFSIPPENLYTTFLGGI